MCLTEDLSLRQIWCVCVCNTSMTDIVVEKWIEYSLLTWPEHLFTRTYTFWWYAIHLSIWVELCVTVPSGKGKLISHLFTCIWSHPSFALPPVISSHSRIFTQEFKTVGVKREEVTPPETEKGLAPFDCEIVLTDKKMEKMFTRWRCPWCNGYRCRIWTRRHEFKSWTRLIAFHIALIPLGKVWIQLFSLQLWVNSRTD